MPGGVNRRDVLKAAGLSAVALSLANSAGAATTDETGKESNSMHPMTAGNMRSAHGGESMACMRYLVWGTKAEKDGFPNVARLFRAIAYAEEVHAGNHFTVLGGEGGAFLVASMAGFGLGTTSENLTGAIEGELFEVNEMYPAYLQVAKAQGEAKSVESIQFALAAEKIHAKMYASAKKSVDAGKDPELGPMQICSRCGYTKEGSAPSACPIGGERRDKFREFA
jgi:rubrerythrin